jgi:RNA polymerase sigma factor (sigma-70 family)
LSTVRRVCASREDDVDLVRRAQGGDTAAFDALYAEHVGRIHALCLRMAGDTRAGDELTQDVFVRAWRRLASFRGDSRFSSWLYRVAVNVVQEARRADGRRDRRVELMGESERIPRTARERSPHVRLDLEYAIGLLPPGARLVLILHDIEGFKQAEIAELTGTAIGTVKAQLHRARRLVRRRLEQ